MTFMSEGETVKLKPGVIRNNEGQADTQTSTLRRQIGGERDWMAHGWTLNKPLHGHLWWPTDKLEVID